ncbi:polysaccharide biosynthesis protein [Paenibacillus sp. HJGM_3]|uniref:polysaccharide biosynthesis protein n=1 Tax=Paenibacillus sp. HJGM_3 TaxID=3379816 RepID=UPI003859E0FF
MSYSKRMTVLVLLDMLIVALSIYTAYMFRFSGDVPQAYEQQLWLYLLLSVAMSAVFMLYFRLYNRIWQYASVGEIISLFKAVALSCMVSYLLTNWLSNDVVPLSIFLRTFETNLLVLGGARFVWRIYRDNYYNKKYKQKRALIIGAGDCGTLIVKELKRSASSNVYPVAFIDDNPLKHKLQVLGVPVLGGRQSIMSVVQRMRIDEIIVAIPSLSRSETSKIIELCKQTKAQLKIVPKFDELMKGQVSLKEIRNVEFEDLLGRDPIHTDLEGIADYVMGKTVLVTGAGGSIGSELCRQLAPFKPARILLLGHGENSIYTIDKQLNQLFPELPLESIIADVQDKQRIQEVFEQNRPHVVFHAAAHKHVPLMEKNPAEAIKNNVFGTQNVADAADKFGAERFVLISTDKAVNPSSIMGATKRIAEMYIQGLGRNSRTKFVAVRFGNVLGSRGSVIPHFKEQIARGGPVTVTHREMIRYFMTIPEAVQLVIQAGSFAQGGEIFILDMGKPVKILDLANDLIRLSGFEPGQDIEIEFSGIRPGEKLFEELLTNEEGLSSTLHNRIFIGKPTNVGRIDIELEFKRLEKVLGEEQETIRDVLKHIVPGYENVS